jgi:hypothetical protein
MSKIKAGLHARGTPGTFKSLAPMLGAPLTPLQLNATVSVVLSKRDYLKKHAETFTAKMAVKSQEIRELIKDMGVAIEERSDGTTLRQDLMGDVVREKEYEKRMGRARKELLKEGALDRVNIMAAVKEAKSKLDAVRTVWSDPVSMLGRMTIGESGLRIYKDNLAGIRPSQMEQRIKEAVLEGNKVKLAACLDVLDNMDPADASLVNISRHECAAIVLSEDWTKAMHHLAAFDLAVLETDRAVADIEGKTIGVQKTLKIGTLKNSLAALHGDIDYDEMVKAETEAGGSGDD